MINFKYVKPLNDTKCIDDFQDEVGYKFSDDFVECARINNGGRPCKNIFDTSAATERTVKKLLSFNKEDEENIWRLNEILHNVNNGIITFAIDNFGNNICFSKKDNSVVFFDSDSESQENIADSFNEFLEGLR